MFLGLLLLAGCPKKDAADEARAAQALLAEVRSLLAARDAALHGYRIEGAVTEAGHHAPFTFAYRAPNRMVATLRLGAERTFAFDGARLVELVPGESRAVRYGLAGPPAEVSVQLHRIFQSFVPEGFRAPVLDLTRARARRASHPRGPEAVELTHEVADEGALVRVTYVLRWRSMDLLEKRLSAGGAEMRLTVREEQCDERLKLCVPTRLEQDHDGKPGATTHLSRVELNATLPQDAFSPEVPSGWKVEERALLSR